MRNVILSKLLSVVLVCVLLGLTVGSVVVAQSEYYATKEEAVSQVPAHVEPKDCFVWKDGPIATPWRVIPGTGCAHWVAHELGLGVFPSPWQQWEAGEIEPPLPSEAWQVCYDGFYIRVADVIAGRTELEIWDAIVGDIWTYDDLTHTGIVRQVDEGRVLVEHCSNVAGGVVQDWFSSGKIWPSASGSALHLSLTTCDSQNFPFIYLTVTVSEDGQPIGDLTKENFSVTENLRLQTDMFDVTPPHVGGGVRMADIVFLVDTSGSMGSEIAAVRDNCVAFANALAASDIDYRLGLVRFGNYHGANPGIIGDGLTDDAETFKSWVGTLGASGSYEPGFAAIRLAIQSYNFRPGAQKVFILITDEESDDRDKQTTIDLILANDVVVHTAVDCTYGTSESDYCGPGSVRVISGGLLFLVTGNYTMILDTIQAELANKYIVRYRTDNPVLDGIERTVVLTVDDGTSSGFVQCTYIPGGAPQIQRTEETLALHGQSLVAGSSPTISVVVTDAAEPFVHSVTLWVRTAGSGGGCGQIAMSSQGNDVYAAEVPGSYVQPPGLDYYIRATDGQVTSSDPGTDPDKKPYQIAVLPNEAPVIEHMPPASWQTGSDLVLEIVYSDSTYRIETRTIYYRRQGDLLWQVSSVAFAPPPVTYVSEAIALPVATWDTPAIEYYIEVTDDLGISSLWPGGGADAPFTVLKPLGPNLTISAPLDFSNDAPFLPNALKIQASVKNTGTVKAEHALVNFVISGTAFAGVELGSMEPGEEKTAAVTWVTDTNVENGVIEVQVTSVGQDDADPSDNVITQRFNFYFVDTRYDPRGFRHDRDAFAFPNWGYSIWQKEYWQELWDFLVAQGLEKDWVTIINTPVASTVFSLLGGAHCYGMSASTAIYYVWPELKPVNKPTFSMKENEAKPDIFERQWEQILHIYPTAYSIIKGVLPYNAAAEYERILDYIKYKNEPILLDLLKPKQCHSVVAYKILEIGDDEKRVYVYENNRPYDDPTDDYPLAPEKRKDKDYYATFRPISNQASYASGRYTWERICAFPIWQTIPIEEILQRIEFILDSWFKELRDKASMSLRIRCPVVPLLTDSQGRSIGYVDASFVNEIPGAQMDQQLDSWLFYLPMGLTYSVELTGTDTGVLGLDFVVPTGEAGARVAVWEDIPATPGSRATLTLSATDVAYEVILSTGLIVEPTSVGEINALDVFAPTSVDVLSANVELYYTTGWLKNVEIRDGLSDKLRAAERSLSRGQTRVAKNQLNAFIHQVQSDENVDPRGRQYLAAYARHIIDNLWIGSASSLFTFNRMWM